MPQIKTLYLQHIKYGLNSETKIHWN